VDRKLWSAVISSCSVRTYSTPDGQVHRNSGMNGSGPSNKGLLQPWRWFEHPSEQPVMWKIEAIPVDKTGKTFRDKAGELLQFGFFRPKE